jgi:RHS repeat-associated protein
MLDNLNLVHMNGRVYDPLVGQFVSPDPFIDGARHTQGWNRYAYVKNGPLSATDPSGFWSRSYRLVSGPAWAENNWIETVVVEAQRFFFVPGMDGRGGLDAVPQGSETSARETIEEVIAAATKIVPQRARDAVGGGTSAVGEIEEVVVIARNPCSAPALPSGESVDKNIRTALNARRSLLAEAGFRPPYATAATDITRRLEYFNGQVRNSGPWDYKQLGGQFEQAGNFNYGATGAALGIPSQVLYRAAGAAQVIAGTSDPTFGSPFGASPYGDDSADQIWIQHGIDYFKNKCSSP